MKKIAFIFLLLSASLIVAKESKITLQEVLLPVTQQVDTINVNTYVRFNNSCWIYPSTLW
jgi:hypothetical protein